MKSKVAVNLFRIASMTAVIAAIMMVVSVYVGTQGFNAINTPVGVTWLLYSSATWIISTILCFVSFCLWLAGKKHPSLFLHPVRGAPYYWVSFSLLVWIIIFFHVSLYLEKSRQPQSIENFATTQALTPTITEAPLGQVIPTSHPSNNSTNGSLPCGERYATASEIYDALNDYRNAHGAGSVSWNDKLAEVANMRVQQTLAGGRDYHQGFSDFTSNQDNFYKVGFAVLSENIGSSGDCPLLGVHLIEQKVAKSPAHDAAQRDPSWIAVGIATNGGVTSFIFGKDPL